MIPKIIHYCWFGHGKMSPMMKKCIKSWKKYCPGYEIIEWNEDNFDINSSAWTREAYEVKKYAFVADYVRLKVMYEHGGIYMDTDQELIKPLGPFMKYSGFMGFMDQKSISMGLFGMEKENSIVKELLSYYDNRKFIVDGKPDLSPNTDWVTQILMKNEFVQNNQYQEINGGIHIFPQTYFCPTSCVSIEDCTSKETVSLHHWAMTWRTEKAKKDFARVKRHQRKWYKIYIYLRYLPNRIIRKIFGDKTIDKLKEKLKI